MGENYTIAIETNGTIENFRYTNFTFGWGSVGCGFYNITIPKSLNNTKILAISDMYQGAFEPDEILMNATHYFIYYSCRDYPDMFTDVFFGSPNVKISISSTTSYIGFQVNIEVNRYKQHNRRWNIFSCLDTHCQRNMVDFSWTRFFLARY